MGITGQEEVDCLRQQSAAWQEERSNLTSQLQQHENSAAIARDHSAALAAELQKVKALLVEVENAHKQELESWDREKQELLSKLQQVSPPSEKHALASTTDAREIGSRLRRLEEDRQDTVVQLTSEFHEFDNDRRPRSVAPGQIWAMYENGAEADSLPRRYALVSEVRQVPFKVVMKWLAPVPTRQNLEWNEATGNRVACGHFKVGNERSVYDMRSFSHLVTPVKGLQGYTDYYPIYPRKQDVWALYQRWPDLRKSRDNRLQYDLVEVMSDFCDVMGVDVALLAQVSGFRTLFKRCQAAPIKYPAKDFWKFSHRVPAYRMFGNEVAGLPRDCLELDPLGLPFEFIRG